MPRPVSVLTRLLRILPLVAIAAVAIMVPVGHAVAADATPPTAITDPLGHQGQVAVVPYGQILEASQQGRINAAVVDTSEYWVAAADRAGRVLAAQIPRPTLGADFATAPGAAAADSPPSAFTLADALRADGATVIAPTSQSESSALSRYLLLPFLFTVLGLLTIGLFMFMRRRGGGRSGAAAHGRMRKDARVSPPKERFADIAGCDEVVEELREVVTFLREPERFSRVGARMPRGVALYGPPGTGKTLLAKAVAGESGVPFFAISGSDFVDTFVGVGASRVRDLFTQARASEEGAIIFFDEIDAIGRARGSGQNGADSEREGTLNQLLVELDGFASRDRIVVIAATNRLDMLDQALLRPGRFDRRVQVGLPAEGGRLEILRLHSADMPIADPSSLADLARVTAGMAGADLANVVNEAAIMAGRDGRDQITGADLDEGLLRAVAGPQRADRRMAEGELDVIAWHEAGHALAAELCPTHAPTQRVTITSRGDTGGLALYGNQDRALSSQQQIHERMVVAMAGRAAEQLRFGAISSGAANDIEVANRLAREAVERLGFSPRVGQIATTAGPHQVPLSGEVRRVVDEEIGRMVDAAYADALALLADHRDELDALAGALLSREQLDRVEIERLVGGLDGASRRRPAEVVAAPLPHPAPAPVAAIEPEAAVTETTTATATRGGRLGRLARAATPRPAMVRAAADAVGPAVGRARGRLGAVRGGVAIRTARGRRKRPELAS